MKKAFVYDELIKIEKESGLITPENVVGIASNPSSPLHDLFEWDDTVAGQQYRFWQARQLIASIRIEFKGRKVQAFHNVVMQVEFEKRGLQGYANVERIMSDDILHRQLLKQAVDEITYWNKKYESIKELEGLLNEDKLSELSKSLG